MTTKTFQILSLAAALAGAVWAQAPAATPPPAAAPPPVATPSPGAVPNKVGVIQIQAAIVSTKDGQAAAAELETRLGPRRKELEKMQADIKDLQDQVQRGGNTLNDKKKEDMQRSIDSKTKNFNRDMEDAQAEYDTESRKMIDDLGAKIMQVIDKYAQERGFSVILDVSNPNTPVLYASNAVDITKEIIELYDKTQPTLPAPTKPAAAKPAGPGAAKPPAIAPVKKQP